MHRPKQCLVNQREVFSHTNSFARALRAALREDPDIVLVGEMRDLETMALALETAATGHLVFGTLHTSTAVSTVDRVIGLFPADQQEQTRMMLSESLRGVMAQTLCRRKHGGRVAAVEILVANTAVAALIRDRKTYQLATFMTTAGQLGCQLLNNELKKLVVSDTVTVEEAMAKAVDKQDLAMKLGMEPPPET